MLSSVFATKRSLATSNRIPSRERPFAIPPITASRMPSPRRRPRVVKMWVLLELGKLSQKLWRGWGKVGGRDAGWRDTRRRWSGREGWLKRERWGRRRGCRVEVRVLVKMAGWKRGVVGLVTVVRGVVESVVHFVEPGCVRRSV